eukprot:TRINITY_DN29508_c0_g1_i1.p1 TRINITY_DN29508_c0_g1~~TRINITY_DN29508_c0_g1_i1.p1  ORF type:complete len:151 (+),score=15.08 TRINITY_DN29508_c0_g1_i1:249-701(+)
MGLINYAVNVTSSTASYIYETAWTCTYFSVATTFYAACGGFWAAIATALAIIPGVNFRFFGGMLGFSKDPVRPIAFKTPLMVVLAGVFGSILSATVFLVSSILGFDLPGRIVIAILTNILVFVLCFLYGVYCLRMTRRSSEDNKLPAKEE